MRTESNVKTSSTDRRQMDEESRERANGFLPAGVALVPKEELQRYLKCKRIGNYLLGKTIGEGSFARVKQGFHVLTGEKVAIKIIDKKQAHQDKYVARNMRREAKIMQMIRHPNIVQLLEVVETEHRYYLITELAAGGDLMDYICYRRKLGEVEVRKFIRQTVSAVHYLHQGGILHRDLKVENLLLDDDYNIKIIDFGLSNTMFIPSSDGQSTREFLKTQCGSPAYAAPEILGHKPYGPEVDVWSIGVNMFAMLTGKLPYTAEPFHITTLYNKMKNNDMNPIPDHLSAPCKDLIRRFLTFNREQRITLEEALGHEWLRKGYDGPVIPVLFPSYPRDEEMDKNILRHMTDKMDFQQLEIIDAVTQNRSTSAATVYHLLKRKLKKYYIKHPEKAKLITGAETIKGSTESVKDSRGIAQEKENKNPIKNKPECIVATAVVCDFNDKEEIIQKEQKEGNDSDSKKLEVPTCRKRLSSASSENLSTPNGELPESKTDTPKEDAVSSRLESETDGAEKSETCNIFSSAGIEISRKKSCNYSSVEVMAIKGRRLSLNLSHISVESKITLDEEPLKNSSVENIDEHSERKETTVEDKMVSPRRVDTMPNLTQEKTIQKSPRHTAPNTPSKVGKVSLINSKVISIPLQPTRQDSSVDKAKLTRKFSLPQSYLPPRNLGTNKERQPITSPFSFASPSSSTKTKRMNRNSLPPYGLCCQLTAIKAQDENDESASCANEDRSRADHEAQCIGPDARPAQTWRNLYRSPTSTDKGKQRRKTIATSGGKELLKSINNTLGKLMEVQDKTEPVKAHAPDSLLLRSRLPPTTLNGPKRESPVEGVKISLIQEDATTERVKERRNSGLKISCRMKDTHSHMPQVLSTSNSESNSTKEQERAARRRNRRTLENKVPIITSKDVLSRRDESGNLKRHVRDDKYESSNQSPRGGWRPSRDSLEKLI